MPNFSIRDWIHAAPGGAGSRAETVLSEPADALNSRELILPAGKRIGVEIVFSD